ncbi:MAG: AAA family ATPase [Gammaproteobacteria bacterium]|nr:AAA family ATPase [Gammaproteobacteria bacterium]
MDHLEGLNPEQRAAVLHFEGPLLVLAGAGTGKTRALTCRIAHLVREHGVPPHRILAVTFTNKAAGEMRERVANYLGEEPRGMWLGTFHALGARLLRIHADEVGRVAPFTIFDAEQSLNQVKRAQKAARVNPDRWNPRSVQGVISSAKNVLIGPQQFHDENADGADPLAAVAALVYPEYQAALARQNAFDFDDLLMRPVELLESHPDILYRYSDRFAFLLVDEYQDTNHAQFRLLDLLARTHGNLMVVGDDDQSIYGWRGADIRNILQFESVFPSACVVRLERNYRSTGHVLQAANAAISHNVARKAKTLHTRRPDGELLSVLHTATEADEARCIADEAELLRQANGWPYRSFAVLYRTNAQSRALEEELMRRFIPYQIVGGVRFYERREIRDVLAYLRLISNPRDEEAFIRVVNYPKRGIGTVSRSRLTSWAGEHGVSLLEAAAEAHAVAGIRPSTARTLRRFARMIRDWRSLARERNAGEVTEAVVTALDLRERLREEGPEGEDRAANVTELIAAAFRFDPSEHDLGEGEEIAAASELDLFLQHTALVTGIDAHDSGADAVTLMTLHSAKGLEFPCVFLAGMEEGLFPLSRALELPDELEEERRLFYVGITRAEEKLYLSYAERRWRAGEGMTSRPSSFLGTIPDTLVEYRRSSRLQLSRHRYRARGAYREGRHGGESLDRSQAHADPDPARYDDLNQDAPRYRQGERVVHGTFGFGSILDISGFGPDLRVTVDFDDVGRKKLVARFAGLERAFE